MDLLFPISARISSATWTLVSNSAAARSVFTGAVRTLDRTGDRWRVAVTTENANNDREDYPVRAALKAFRANARGQTNRIWFCDTSYSPRGSFPSVELLPNGSFVNGSSGYSADNATLTAADRVLQVRRSSGSAANSGAIFSLSTAVGYAPYVFRGMTIQGRNAAVINLFVNGAIGSNSVSGSGLLELVYVPIDGGIGGEIYDSASGRLTDDYFSVPYLSLSRCALIDNRPNALLWSDQFNQASWNKTACTISANTVTAPDGTSTGDSVVEDGTNATHGVYQDWTVSSTTLLDYCASCVFSRSGRTWAFIQMDDLVDSSRAWVNLTTGALGTVTRSGNWTNARAFVKNLGANWFQLFLVAKKGSSATTVRTQCAFTTGDTTVSYAGSNGSTAGYLWRGGTTQSPVPFSVAQTVGTGVPTGSAQTGASIYIKGLPASTTGLLFAGDRVQVGTQLNEVVAPLNSDSAGLGYLQCAVPWRTSPSNGDPVIINQPMGRFILTSPEGGWDDRPGIFSTFSFEMEEALDQ